MEEPKQIEEPKKFNLLEWTTIIYAFLTFLGYSYIDFFYKAWGINISEYLDFSEMLLSLLNNLNFLIINIIVNLIIYTITLIYFTPRFLNRSASIKSNTRIIVEVIFLFFITIPLIITYVYYQSAFVILFVKFICFNVVILILFIFLYKNIPTALNKLRLVCSKKIRLILVAIIYLFIFNLSSSLYFIRSIRNKTIITNYSFIYESTTYKSNDSLLYIGATSKYIFLRNTKDSTNLIFDKANIKNLSLTEKHILY